MASKRRQSGLDTAFVYMRRIEDGLLVIILCVMVFLAASQIVLRNVFDSGIFWGDIQMSQGTTKSLKTDHHFVDELL